MTVRVGVVGLGMMGTTHFKGYRVIEEAKLVALCDVQAQRLQGDFSGTAGNIDTGTTEREDVSDLKPYDDFEKLVADPDVDLIDICLPTYQHEEKAVQALQAGKHVFCEKPMAMDYQQACRMIETANQAGKMLMVGQCLRFWPEYVMLKEIIDSGRYGRPKSAVLRRLGAAPSWSWENWLLQTDRSGGCALDLHIHDVDTVNWFFGKPAGVCSHGTRLKDGGIGHILTCYRYDDGPVVFADGSWEFHGAYPFSMSAVVVFETATVDYHSSAQPTMTIYHADGSTETPEIPAGDAYTDELRYFAQCIEKGTAPDRVPNDSAALAVGITLAEIESVNTGQPVPINL